MHKADATPTIQCRVDAQTFERFSALAEHYKCSNAELLRASFGGFSKTTISGDGSSPFRA